MKKLLLGVTFLISFNAIAAEWTKGEVRRIDLENKKITIKHEEIKNLEMPPMSMVFYVDNSALLKEISLGDQIEFIANQKGSKYFVKQIKRSIN